ncbi:hypothetical protein [Streptomyces sp. NPDC049040]|uniref:hypothetical protein n=1 Tax=Streptomyces sp. NPDC049040 TaxID=3365593 RepID=UPI003720C48F
MTESEPPRIRVILPGSREVPGRLIRWRQDKRGLWWAQVELYVPGGAVNRLPGEDYAAVPREPATPDAPRYVLAVDTRDSPPTAELHLETCWELRRHVRWRRVTPLLDGLDGPDMLRFDDTTRCPVCLTPA